MAGDDWGGEANAGAGVPAFGRPHQQTPRRAPHTARQSRRGAPGARHRRPMPWGGGTTPPAPAGPGPAATAQRLGGWGGGGQRGGAAARRDAGGGPEPLEEPGPRPPGSPRPPPLPPGAPGSGGAAAPPPQAASPTVPLPAAFAPALPGCPRRGTCSPHRARRLLRPSAKMAAGPGPTRGSDFPKSGGIRARAEPTEPRPGRQDYKSRRAPRARPAARGAGGR